MRLYLIRHGETDWNREKKVQGSTDIPLNENGRRLAEEAGKGMRDMEIDLAFTSPLMRARETAKLVLKGRDVPIYEDKRIQEISFGVLEGICLEEERASCEQVKRFFYATGDYEVPEGGESIPELEARVRDFLEELYRKPELQDKHILISTHGAALTAMLHVMRGETGPVDFWSRGVPKNCSVTEVEVKDGKPEILSEEEVYS